MLVKRVQQSDPRTTRRVGMGEDGGFRLGNEARRSIPASSPTGALPPVVVEGVPAELDMAAATASSLLPASLDTVIVPEARTRLLSVQAGGGEKRLTCGSTWTRQ